MAGLDTSPYLKDLPDELLKKIISYLNLADLQSFKNTCVSFDKLCSDNKVWKNAPFELGLLPVLRLSQFPYLSNINGQFEEGNILIQLLLEHVEDLKIFNCTVFKNTSVHMFLMFLQKYSNLEWIKLNSYLLQTPEILETLANLPYLETMIVYYSENIGQILQNSEIIDSKFMSLKRLEVVGSTFTQTDKNFLSSFITVVLPRLTEIHVLLSVLHPHVLNLLLHSATLEKFELNINKYINTTLDFQHMINLKSLKLIVSYNYFQAVQIFNWSTLPNCLETLGIEFCYLQNFNVSIVGNAIQNLQNLKCLSAINVNDVDIDNQLSHISRLKNLREINLNGCKNLSSHGLNHITQCLLLQKIVISGIKFKSCNYECLMFCKFLSDIELSSCTLSPTKLCGVITALFRLKNIKLYFCKLDNNKGYVSKSDEYNMIQHCNALHRSVRVLCFPACIRPT